MANLKDLIVNGAARIIGKTYSSEFVGNLTGNVTGNAKTATTADKTAYGISVEDAANILAVSGWNGSADKTLTIKGESPVTTTATDGKITVSHDNSTVTAGTYKSVTVDAKGHVTAGTNPTTLSGYGITDAEIASGVITLGSNTITPLTSASTLAAGKVSGTLATSNIPDLDASKITTGTFNVDRLPVTALERCVVVADDTARFKLTESSVQVGDTVKVAATKKMYMVVDSDNLSTEAGYEEYFTSTDWSTITNKPSSYTPSSHTHTKSQITDFPTKMPASDVYDWAKAENKPSYAWSEITDKPSTFTPAAHSHSDATTSASGFMSSTDKTKLDGIAESAEVNQNAFSNVKVGDVTVAADSKTDTLTLTAGNNITLTPDAANDKITISSSYVTASTSTSGIVTTDAQTFAGAKTFSDTTDSTSNTSGAVIISGGLGVAKNIYAAAVHNAVWNDLVDCMEVPEDTSLEFGYCYSWEGDSVIKSSRSSKNCIGIHSNTAGFVMGEKKTKTIQAAVAGFVLAYVDKLYPEGTPLTWGDNGTLTKCSLLKRVLHPERIIATFYKEEKEEKWHNLPVSGRHWVKVV